MSDPDSDTASTLPMRNFIPLCPTRWLVRLPATPSQYVEILYSLDFIDGDSTANQIWRF